MSKFLKKEIIIFSISLFVLIAAMPKLAVAADYTQFCPATVPCTCYNDPTDPVCFGDPNNCTEQGAVNCPPPSKPNSQSAGYTCSYSCTGCSNCGGGGMFSYCKGGVCTCNYWSGACNYNCTPPAVWDPTSSTCKVAGPGCSVWFSKPSYTIPETITINFSDAPANTNLGLINPNGTAVINEKVVGSGFRTYTLRATDPIGSWSTSLVNLSSIPICRDSDAATISTVVSPVPGPETNCSDSLDNDEDGRIDCNDHPDCYPHPDCDCPSNKCQDLLDYISTFWGQNCDNNENFSDPPFIFADTNRDGEVDILDATIVGQVCKLGPEACNGFWNIVPDPCDPANFNYEVSIRLHPSSDVIVPQGGHVVLVATVKMLKPPAQEVVLSASTQFPEDFDLSNWFNITGDLIHATEKSNICSPDEIEDDDVCSKALILTVKDNARIREHDIKITGEHGGLIREATFRIEVTGPDFDITLNPPLPDTPQGKAFNTKVVVTLKDGASKPVNLSVDVPEELVHSLIGTECTPPAIDESCELNFVIGSNPATPVGNYPFKIIGQTEGGDPKEFDFNFNVIAPMAPGTCGLSLDAGSYDLKQTMWIAYWDVPVSDEPTLFLNSEEGEVKKLSVSGSGSVEYHFQPTDPPGNWNVRAYVSGTDCDASAPATVLATTWTCQEVGGVCCPAERPVCKAGEIGAPGCPAGDCCGFPEQCITGGGGPVSPPPFFSFENLTSTLVNLVFWLAVVIAPIMYLIGAFYFITSGGDIGKTQTARKIFLYTTIGLFIVLLARGIIYAIQNLLSSP